MTDDAVNTERPTESLTQKSARLEAEQPKPATAREELLQLMASWMLTAGRGAREHADRILNRHAHELAEQLRERGDSAMEAADANGGRTTPSDPKYDKAATWYAAADLTDPAAQQ